VVLVVGGGGGGGGRRGVYKCLVKKPEEKDHWKTQAQMRG